MCPRGTAGGILAGVPGGNLGVPIFGHAEIVENLVFLVSEAFFEAGFYHGAGRKPPGLILSSNGRNLGGFLGSNGLRTGSQGRPRWSLYECHTSPPLTALQMAPKRESGGGGALVHSDPVTAGQMFQNLG